MKLCIEGTEEEVKCFLGIGQKRGITKREEIADSVMEIEKAVKSNRRKNRKFVRGRKKRATKRKENMNKRWTIEETQRLMQLYSEKKSFAQIAKELNRSTGGVRNRIYGYGTGNISRE